MCGPPPFTGAQWTGRGNAARRAALRPRTSEPDPLQRATCCRTPRAVTHPSHGAARLSRARRGGTHRAEAGCRIARSSALRRQDHKGGWGNTARVPAILAAASSDAAARMIRIATRARKQLRSYDTYCNEGQRSLPVWRGAVGTKVMVPVMRRMPGNCTPGTVPLVDEAAPIRPSAAIRIV
eukprot:gene14427-biopygen6615